LYSSVYLALLRAGLLNCAFMWASFRVLTLSPLSVKSMQPYSDPNSPCDQRTGSGIVTLELFASAAAIQPSAAALEAGLMEQEQHHYPCSAVLP
jgi:hypothetical protein